MNSKTIFSKLIEISDFSENQKNWNTPRIVLNSSLDMKKAYIRGFFDAEGGVPHVEEHKIEPKNIRVHFTQSNKKCLEELKTMLHETGLRTGRVCGPYYKKGYESPLYRLKIHGRKEVADFFNHIGSLHPEKQKRLCMINEMIQVRA